jgi:hypothetical protein
MVDSASVVVEAVHARDGAAAGGFELSFVDAVGVECRGPLSLCWNQPFERGSQVRAFVSRFGQRHFPGWWWSVTMLDAVTEPRNLGRLKQVIVQRWGVVPLIDALKEAILRSNCRATIAAMTGSTTLADAFLQRLLLCIHGYGTNTGIRAVAAAGAHGHREHELYYTVRRHLTPDLVRALAIDIANATFAVCQQALWGGGSSAVASDSTHFGALINCTASEVAAMVDGAMHHGTEMDVAANYVDTHGQSVIGFGLTRLLGFDLLPRIKRINHLRLYPAQTGWRDALPTAGAGVGEPADRLGPDRRRVRPYDQVCDFHQEQDRYDRGDPAPVPPREPVAPHLPGDAGVGPCAADHLRVPVSTRPRTPAGDQLWVERGRVLEPGQRGDLLRQGRRHSRQPS